MNTWSVHGSVSPVASNSAFTSVAASSTTAYPAAARTRRIDVLPDPGAPVRMKRFIVLLMNPARPAGNRQRGQTDATRAAPGPWPVFGRLHGMDGAELYGSNAADMWASLAPWSRVSPGPAAGLVVVDIAAQRATRLILRQPLAADTGQVGALVRRAAERGRVVVEDSFGGLALPAGGGITVHRFPIMIRPAAAIEPLPSLAPRGAG